MVLGGEDDDVVAVEGIVVVYDVDAVLFRLWKLVAWLMLQLMTLWNFLSFLLSSHL